jgi:hypothetical protein
MSFPVRNRVVVFAQQGWRGGLSPLVLGRGVVIHSTRFFIFQILQPLNFGNQSRSQIVPLFVSQSLCVFRLSVPGRECQAAQLAAFALAVRPTRIDQAPRARRYLYWG